METPLLKQYREMKKKHPDAVLLFRVGDFYETFGNDAVIASEILGLTLTRRQSGVDSRIELAGFPHHALDTYLPKLVRAGKQVAICEQLENPKLTNKLVKRGITEVNTKDNIDLSIVRSFFALLNEITDMLFLFIGMRNKAEDIREAAYKLRISPKYAFEYWIKDIENSLQQTISFY